MNQLQADISVVITCYREGQLVFDAVNSALNQSLPVKEVILVNDASTHSETNLVCRELEKNSQVKVIWREQNGGTSAARNDGFGAAIGDILVPLDADDILPADTAMVIQQAFATKPDAAFVYGRYLRQDQANTAGQVVDPGEITLKRMLSAKGLSLSSQWKLLGTTPLRRSLWASIGGYDLKFGVADLHDVEFWMRAIATGCSYHHIPETIYIWRKYFGSNTRKVTPLAWYRIAQQHLDIYQQLDLEYRAYELLLLGSKWLNHPQEIREYSHKLWQCIQAGNFQLSSLIALGIPTPLLQYLAKKMNQKR
jgi:glycosyltransferase involved in cell wall biosynthesis